MLRSSFVKSKDHSSALLVVLGDQLFHPKLLAGYERCPIFMAEDWKLCRRPRHHQHKLVLFLAAMRQHAAALRQLGWQVHYSQLAERDPHVSYADYLVATAHTMNVLTLLVPQPSDRWFREKLLQTATQAGLHIEWLPNPHFLTSLEDGQVWFNQQRQLRMQNFWIWQRQRLSLLLDSNGGPQGGRWSFDVENRKKLPNDVELPELPRLRHSPVVQAVIKEVSENFSDHPGDAETFNYPTTRHQAQRYLQHFCSERLDAFGPYQDALTERSDTVFHAVLTPMLNCGLLTPREVVTAVLRRHQQHPVPIASLEGFFRQVVGWREFIHVVDDRHGEHQAAANHYRHERQLSAAWWHGDTGIPPLDASIKKALRTGYLHHIERLMVIGNMMLISEIHPQEAYRWFMEMTIDSADWVMGPNVFGMALRSDGGLMTTKPYCCGSSYWRKMGPWPKGPWCDIVDGLYWRFVDRQRQEFRRNPRMAAMVSTFDRMNGARRTKILNAAETWLHQMTRSSSGHGTTTGVKLAPG